MKTYFGRHDHKFETTLPLVNEKLNQGLNDNFCAQFQSGAT